jgi:hypothetical protein
MISMNGCVLRMQIRLFSDLRRALITETFRMNKLGIPYGRKSWQPFSGEQKHDAD